MQAATQKNNDNNSQRSLKVDFPSSFLWGAAISSYQTEGRNYNCDWYLWEKENKLQPAGQASRHYDLFREDFKKAKELNLKAIRFSVEWARICPSPGDFSPTEILHYKEVIKSLKSYQLEPIITLHHFTNPIWFYKKDGWLNAKNIDYFLEYVRKVVYEFREDVRYWLVLNEPLVYVYNGFIRGNWPPGIKNINTAKRVLNNMIEAYICAYDEIKNIYKNNNITCEVSFAKHMRFFCACPNFNLGQNSVAAILRNKIFNISIIDFLHKKSKLDFITFNYYCKEYVKFKSLIGTECAHEFHRERRNALGWYIHPEGLYTILRKFKKYGLGIFIMENGTAETNDIFYEEYLKQHIKAIAMAYSQGVDLRGYLWWSLLDNFEWDKGFSPRFGLVEVDYKTFERKIRPFARTYAKICKENSIDI